MNERDKLAGCIIGLAVGDALGVPHEFKNQRNNIYTGLLYLIPTFTFRNGTRRDVIGQYSDDTEMSLCILRSVIQQGHYDRNQMILSYEKWAEHSKAMGKNTRALLKGVKTISGYQKRYQKIFGVPVSEWTQSNGSLMRAAILAFVKDRTAIIEDCTLTNPHPINIQCNIIYCFMITVCNYPKHLVIEVIIEDNYYPEILDTIREAIQDVPTTAHSPDNHQRIRNLQAIGKGWVLHGLYCAVWGWYHFESYQEAIDAIIRRGGDTDTNAAIAGALIGATLGYDKLIQENRTRENIQIVRTADFNLGENPRPADFSLIDFDTMIDNFLLTNH